MAVFNKDAKDDDVKWITANGTHIALNKEGTAVSGALKGQNFSDAESTSTSKTSTASSSTSQSNKKAEKSLSYGRLGKGFQISKIFPAGHTPAGLLYAVLPKWLKGAVLKTARRETVRGFKSLRQRYAGIAQLG